MLMLSAVLAYLQIPGMRSYKCVTQEAYFNRHLVKEEVLGEVRHENTKGS